MPQKLFILSFCFFTFYMVFLLSILPSVIFCLFVYRLFFIGCWALPSHPNTCCMPAAVNLSVFPRSFSFNCMCMLAFGAGDVEGGV